MSIEVNWSRCLLLCFRCVYLGICTANTKLQSKFKKTRVWQPEWRLENLSIIACYECFEVEATCNSTKLEKLSVFEKNVIVNCYLESTDACYRSFKSCVTRKKTARKELNPALNHWEYFLFPRHARQTKRKVDHSRSNQNSFFSINLLDESGDCL